MPAADYSSYHQPNATAADGTKFDNFIDAVQATVNALDKNNLAAGAGILASQLADPTTGKVLGSAASACAAVFPPGYAYTYDELTASVTGIVATTAGTATTIKTSSSFTFDGTAVWVEFFAPRVTNTTAGVSLFLELFEDSTDKGTLAVCDADAAAGGDAVCAKRKLTPAAGAHTYTVKAFVSSNSGSVIAGLGGAGNNVPAYILVTKA